MNPLIPIIVSFLLTVVLGGALSYYFQGRTWKHQRSVSLSDRELQKADAVCRQVSSLQDKLLYRMVRLYRALRLADESDGREIAEAQLKKYDESLFEWNDQRNVSLALVGSYFGKDARKLYREIQGQCQLAEADLDTMYNDIMRDRPSTIDISSLEQHLKDINKMMYWLGVFMMVQIRGGQVGRAAPNPIIPQVSLELLAGLPMTLPGITTQGSSGAS